MAVVTRQRASVVPLVGLATAVALIAVAMLVPWAFDWDVHARWFPPLHARWDPRIGPGTTAAVLIGVLGVVAGPRLTRTLGWRALLGATFVLGLGWMLSLATVDGSRGIDTVLGTRYEYLPTARAVTDLSTTLHEFVARIPYSHPDNWPVHVAGHPPGALLFFVVLVRLGLGSGLAAGLVVTAIAATTPVAVLLTLRRLGSEAAARKAAPFLVLGPAAIWMAVSADAIFAAVAAWGLCCLALAATTRDVAQIAWAALAGLLLGYCVMLSYGLPLLGVLALAVLWLAGSWRPLPWVAGAAAVVVGFAFAGFSWWEAYPVLRARYWDGIAGLRPASYWLWGDLAALCCSAGPLLGAGIAATVQRLADRARGVQLGETRIVVTLTTAALVTVVVADLSLMSKAEVERIWLPFVPWLLVSCALLPSRWQRTGLAVQVGFALVVQHLLFTGW